MMWMNGFKWYYGYGALFFLLFSYCAKSEERWLSMGNGAITNVTKIGNPMLARWPQMNLADAFARGVKDMEYFEGKIYMGAGDLFDNRGPVDVWSLATNSAQFVNEITLNEEEIYNMHAYGTKLLVPGLDSRGSWEDGEGLYVKSSDTWLTYGIRQALHMFDAAIFSNVYYVYCTYATDPYARVSKSRYGGTWDTVATGTNAGSPLIAVDDGLLILSSGCPIKRYNGTTLEVLTPQCVSASKATRWRNGVAWIESSGDYVRFVTNFNQQTEGARVVGSDDVYFQDLLAPNTQTCYVLVADANNWVTNQTGWIYGSTNLMQWTKVAEFVLPGKAQSFELMGGNFYIGLGAPFASYTNAQVTTEAGSIYKIWAMPMPAPTGLSATKGTYCDKISLSWSSVSNATSYVVYRNTSSSSSSSTPIATNTSSVLSYDDSSITPGSAYYYWVKAKEACGGSDFSAGDYGYANLATPTGFSGWQGVSALKVQLNWTALSGATGYIIYRSRTNSSASAAEIGRTSSTYYDDTAPSATLNTVYYYWIKAYSSLSTSAFSSVASGYSGLPAPGGVSASGGNYCSGVWISWNGVSGVISYRIWRSTSADSSSSINLGETAYTSFIDVSAAPGIVYYYWVQSKKWSALSSFSGSASGWRRSMAAGNNARGDLDGDGIMDFAVYQETTGMWYARLSGSGYSTVSYQLGSPGFVPVSCDYDGDGRTDPTVYYEPDGLWIALLSASGNAPVYAVLGGNGFKPVAGDYDGDGRADGVVYQEATGTWKALLSKRNYELVTIVYGGPGCKPAAADYDGDGMVDPAVYYELPGNNLGQNLGFWYMVLSGSGYLSYTKTTTGVGLVPVPADYDGDGKADVATYNSASGVWNYWSSANNYPLPISFTLGGSEYTAVPADYDGDGKADIAVYHEAPGQWYFLLSSQNYASSYGELGGSGYEPVGARR